MANEKLSFIRTPLKLLGLSDEAITNDPRVISSARTFELEGDTLRYEMEMHTTKVDRSAHHVKITLQRVR